MIKMFITINLKINIGVEDGECTILSAIVILAIDDLLVLMF